MYLIDEEKRIIHDLTFPKFECQIKKIPEDKRKKVFTIDQVKRMISTEHIPQYNGCRFCLADLHMFDMNSIFSR